MLLFYGVSVTAHMTADVYILTTVSIPVYLCMGLAVTKCVGLPPVVHDELARIAPHELADGRERHIKGQERVVAQDFEEFLWSRTVHIVIRAWRGFADGRERAGVDRGAGSCDM